MALLAAAADEYFDEFVLETPFAATELLDFDGMLGEAVRLTGCEVWLKYGFNVGFVDWDFDRVGGAGFDGRVAIVWVFVSTTA